MNKLPTKFEMCTSNHPYYRYTLTKQVDSDYSLTPSNRPFLAEAWDTPFQYSKERVKKYVDEGTWIIAKNLDEPEIAVEPDMKFPFTAIHKDHMAGDEIAHKEMFEVTKGYVAGRVTCTYVNDGGVAYNNCFPQKEVERYIKDGTWIVKQVGPVVPEEAWEKAEEVAAKYPLKIDDNGCVSWFGPTGYSYQSPIGFTGDEACFSGSDFYINTEDLKPGYYAPQPPASLPNTTSKLTIEVDTEAVTANVEQLTQALEKLAKAYKDVIELQMKLKGVL